jgi:hypothetical protein
VRGYLRGSRAAGAENLSRFKGQSGGLLRQRRAALADPAFKAQLADLALDPFVSSQADFAKFIVDFSEKWRNVIHAADIKPE